MKNPAGSSGFNGIGFTVLVLILSIAIPSFAIKICPACKARFDNEVNFCPHDGKTLTPDKDAESGKVEITVDPPHSEISIDGLPRGEGPKLSLELPGGEHKFEATADGFASQKLRISIIPGQNQSLTLELSEANSFPPPLRYPSPTPASNPLPEVHGLPPDAAGAEPREEIRDFSSMVEVKAGSYLLGNERGNSDERPLRRVKTPGFFIDRYEATCHQYQRFLNSVKRNGHLWCHPLEPASKDHTPFHTYAWALRFSWVGGKFPSGMEDFPVVLIDWFDAYAYAHWAGKRLPTEDEWEIAAGAGDGREYPWGNNFGPENCALGDSPVRVGGFPDGRAPWGAEDMAGNVGEWTATAYEPEAGDGRVFGGRHGQPIIRGGSWDDNSRSCRISARDVHRSPYYRSTTVGFRCVADKPREEKNSGRENR